MHIPFATSERSTIGVEWELALVDQDSGDLRQVAQTVLDAVAPADGGEHPHIRQELLLNTVEVVSGVCHSVREVTADLQRSIDEIRPIIDPLRVELMCAGTHPFARWTQQKVTDKVLPISRAMLTHYGHFQALSASSPFWGGDDTGYASNRALMFQQLPTAGLPFQFDRWSELEQYVDDMLKTGVIDVFDEIRWDIRPSPKFGTLEMRICDGIPSMSELASIAALTQCLVEHYSRELDAGRELPSIPAWFVQENKWRAARYGMDAILILDRDAREELVTDDLERLLVELEPVAEDLDCVEELAGVRAIINEGASYERQRAVASRNGGAVDAVVAALVAEMRAGRPVLHQS